MGRIRAEHTERASTALVETWNAHHPIGTPVKLVKDLGDVLETRTRSEAYVIPSGSVMVKVEGIAGGYRLSRVVPIPQA